MPSDLLFLAHNRLEFTRASMAALEANTDWSKVDRLVKFVDVDERGRDDGTQNAVLHWHPPGPTSFTRVGHWGGPVNIMQRYLEEFGGEGVFAKIDNDVIVPPGWWTAGIEVMSAHPELDLLGIEPPLSRTRSPYGGQLPPAPEYKLCTRFEFLPEARVATFANCDAIGGIGFMRASCFLTRPPMRQHSTHGGFTDWQVFHNRRGPHWSNGDRDPLVCGWIVPPLRLFLLDRLPIEPWASLSRKYIAEGVQRKWTDYLPEAAPMLWQWWLNSPSLEVA